MLEAAGIVTHVPGTYLTDEYAMTQRVTGNIGAAVYVPRSRLAEAQAIIAAHPLESELGERFEEAAEADPPPEAEPDPSEAAKAVAAAAQTPALSRRAIAFEIIAVCCVTELPSYVSSFSGLIGRGWRPWDWHWSLESSLHQIAWTVPLIILLRWVISRSGQPASDFGWTRFRPVRDVVAGLILLAAFSLVVLGLMKIAFAGSGHGPPPDDFLVGSRYRRGTPPVGWLEWSSLVAAAVAVGFFEELSARGYLMNRLRTLLGSPAKAAIISSAVWAGGHVYQGLLPVGLHFIEGLVLACALFLLKRLWPLVIAHAGFDLILEVARNAPG